jgi:hypothetical protein
LRFRDKNKGTADIAGTQLCERIVRPLERERFHFGPDGHARCELKKLLAVTAREVRHGPQ